MLRILFSVGLLLAAATSRADQLQIRWLNTERELIHDFVRTSWPTDSDRIEIPNRPTAVIEFPVAMAETIEKHIAQAFKIGSYNVLDLNDFFHGHLILRGPKTEFDSAEEFFADVSLILYHTAEYNNRWKHEESRGVPVEQRAPRSLVGFLNGDLQSAAHYVHPLPRHYDSSGTIYGDEIVNAIPGSSSLEYKNFGGVPNVYINLGTKSQPRRCQVDTLEFYLLTSANRSPSSSRYHGPNGEPLDLFIRCPENQDSSTIIYTFVKRGVS